MSSSEPIQADGKQLNYCDKTHFPKPGVLRSRAAQLERAVSQLIGCHQLKTTDGKTVRSYDLLAALYNAEGNVFRALQSLSIKNYIQLASDLYASPEFQQLLSVYNWKQLQRASDVLTEALESSDLGIRTDAAKFILKLEADKQRRMPQVSVQVNQLDVAAAKERVLEIFGLQNG